MRRGTRKPKSHSSHSPLLVQPSRLFTGPLLVSDTQQKRQRGQDGATNPGTEAGFNFGNIPVLPPTTPIIQPKLTIGQPNDKYEQEADRVADRVMRMPEPDIQRQEDISKEDEDKENIQAKPLSQHITPLIQRESDMEEEEETLQAKPTLQRQEVEGEKEEEEEETLQADAAPGLATTATPAVSSRINAMRGGGQPLTPATRAFMEPRFGHDFGQVRVHADSNSAKISQQINARAFTVGQNIAFGAGQYQPESSGGRKLLAHELTHVVQQKHTSDSIDKPVQRKIKPEDVASEMIGREFELTKAFSVFGAKLKPGDKVTILSWVNASETVSAIGGGAFAPFMVPKTSLKPARTAVSGVAPYSTGISGQASAVEESEKKLALWVAKESSYKTKKAVALFKAERKRLEGLLATKRGVLNRKLIQETMFNRFDSIIKKEVDAANSAHGLTGKAALDPNLLKSMLFQESGIGTAGEHLEVPPSHPVKSRFNLGQVIDSSGMALLTLLEKEQPIIISAMLPTMRKDLNDAMKERVILKKKSTLTSVEQVRLTELDRLAGQNWEVFIWSYSRPGTPIRFADVVNAFFSSKSPALNMDYEFWIHIAVMWLFKKHTPGRSWPETIRAYNGSGTRARHYRDAVVKRAKAAATAEKSGKDFIPGKI